MSQHPDTLTRRHFLYKTGLVAAGTLFGNSLPVKALIPPPQKPRIAVILDDVGYNISHVTPFLELGVPITFSILPRIFYSRRLAGMIHDQGHEIMLHQPMEPHNPLINPGPGALYLSQPTEKLHGIISENIDSFSYAVGVNNHMGSLFTESPQKVAAALKVFKTKDFFFIDSVTSHNSHAFDTAARLKMKTACRNIFLDNVPEKSAVCAQLKKLKAHALTTGQAIGIVHPRTASASALADFFGSRETHGLEIKYISGILKNRLQQRVLASDKAGFSKAGFHNCR